jgi:hypothetical protein
MKRVRLTGCICVFLLSACSTPFRYKPPAKFTDADVSVKSFEGWIRIKGEFWLFQSKSDLDQDAPKNCISGYFFPQEKEAYLTKKFSGKKVIVYGTEIDPDQLTSNTPLAVSPVKNNCLGKTVILGRYIALAKS